MTIKRTSLSLMAALLMTSACSEQVVVRETPAECGNGEVDLGEACDDDNEVQGDACTNDCQPARCGDKVLRTDLSPGEDGYEECDDGNESDGDGCLNLTHVEDTRSWGGT